jgi:hypothetical protein|tara:strand:- start:2088 stop:2279 length:192 start_codon:yes stop_codon:yes gene_type:complete
MLGVKLRQALGDEDENKKLEDELERFRFRGDLRERGGRVRREEEQEEERGRDRDDDGRRDDDR